MKYRVAFLCILLSFFLAGVGFTQTDQGSKVGSLLMGLEGQSRTQRITAAKIISRSGLAEPQLYEKIAGLLKEGYQDGTDADHIDEMSWLCKALAASGDEKYRALFADVAKNTQSVKLKHYAEQSSSLLEEYAQRKQILNARENWDEKLTSDENRLVAMLKSDNGDLKRDAAKILVRRIKTEDKVFDIAAESLLGMTNERKSDSHSIDVMSWLCKALGASGNAKFVEVLNQVKAGTEDYKLKNYATKAISAL